LTDSTYLCAMLCYNSFSYISFSNNYQKVEFFLYILPFSIRAHALC